MHAKHPHLKSLAKNKSEGGKAKGDIEDLNVIEGATKFHRRYECRT
jgi:hypothetical protein